MYLSDSDSEQSERVSVAEQTRRESASLCLLLIHTHRCREERGIESEENVIRDKDRIMVTGRGKIQLRMEEALKIRNGATLAEPLNPHEAGAPQQSP